MKSPDAGWQSFQKISVHPQTLHMRTLWPWRAAGYTNGTTVKPQPLSHGAQSSSRKHPAWSHAAQGGFHVLVANKSCR